MEVEEVSNKLLSVVLFIFVSVYSASAQTTEFTYQGRLLNASAPANGSYDFEFVLFDTMSAGSQIGPLLSRSNVVVADGIFTVKLDFGNSFPGANRYLEVRVRPTGQPGITILSPRQLLNSSPYAVRSLSADVATNATTATSATTATNATQLNGQPASFYQNAANINSGTLNSARLFVPLTLSDSSGSHVIRGDNAGDSGIGIYGTSTALTGSGRGVYGSSASPSGIGVSGIASSTTGFNFGVQGSSSGSNGSGVYGVATSGTGLAYGGNFSSYSTSGVAVYGYAPANSGATRGGFFRTDSTSGWAVEGYATAGTGSTIGGYFVSDSTSGRAVYANAGAGSGTIYGVYGSASTAASGYAVYASGDMGASGLKPFRIDHPDDPANKYLLHYATESPEVMNFYSGKVLIDNAGEAVIELPAYFAKINRDPRYMLTAIGAPMPKLHISLEIDEAALAAGAKTGPNETAPKCSFRIAGGVPGAKVSWRVEAVRNDRWVQNRGAAVEVEKQGLEKGTYQHPEFYGQPKEKGIDYRSERELTDPKRP